MIHVKKGLNAIAISISICTTLSAILYLLLGRGSFNLINPFRMQLSIPIFNTIMSLIIYAFFGLFIYTTVELFKNDKLGFTKMTSIHFIVSVIIFSILGMITDFPFGAPIEAIKAYYRDLPIERLFIVPIITSVIVYIVIYLVMWCYYFYQVKKINSRI